MAAWLGMILDLKNNLSLLIIIEQQRALWPLPLMKIKSPSKERPLVAGNQSVLKKQLQKVIGNQVYTIDDTPVLDMIIKYGGLKNVTPENFALEHSIALTLQLQRENRRPGYAGRAL